MSISFWFDPSCPFTWQTSRWLRQAATRHDEPIRWGFLSLAILNEGRDLPERFRRSQAWSHRVLRVLAAVDQRQGQDAVDRLYTEIGVRLHDDGAPEDDELLIAAVKAADLPIDVVLAADDSSFDASVRESHDAAQRRVGAESGSPVTAIGDNRGFFGPVITAVPGTEDGDRLFDGLRLLSSVRQFSEVKSGREPS